MYRSGDRAMRMANGEFAYLGRADDQIKVRGFRIEPREVELCLCGHSEVGSAIVAPHDYGDGDVRLVAYLVPRHGTAMDGLRARHDGAMAASSGIPVDPYRAAAAGARGKGAGTALGRCKQMRFARY